eukprot:13601102-Alexandrium_andersonii.AAC.1
MSRGVKGGARAYPLSNLRPSCRSRRRRGQSMPSLPKAMADSGDVEARVACTYQQQGVATPWWCRKAQGICNPARLCKRISQRKSGSVKRYEERSCSHCLRIRQGSMAFANGLSCGEPATRGK